jgi:hypothetical protein
MLSNLMILAGAFLMGLGGYYIAHHIDGDNLAIPAVIGFAIGIVWLSQAPTIALRKRVRELESKVSGKSSANNA